MLERRHKQVAKELTEVAPPWAMGCDKCRFGIIGAPELLKALTLAEQRSAQAAEDLLIFCDCRAGHLQRQYLRKVYNTMPMAQRTNLREFVVRTPTVHYEKEAA